MYFINETSKKAHKQHKIMDRIISELESSAREQSSTSRGEEKNMDDLTKIILERLERDSREREARYHADAQERELRFFKLVEDSKRDYKEGFAELKSDFKELKSEIKTDFSELKSEFRELKKSTDDTNKWIIGLAITTIVAIVSVAVAVWIK